MLTGVLDTCRSEAALNWRNISITLIDYKRRSQDFRTFLRPVGLFQQLKTSFWDCERVDLVVCSPRRDVGEARSPEHESFHNQWAVNDRAARVEVPDNGPRGGVNRVHVSRVGIRVHHSMGTCGGPSPTRTRRCEGERSTSHISIGVKQSGRALDTQVL